MTRGLGHHGPDRRLQPGRWPRTAHTRHAATPRARSRRRVRCDRRSRRRSPRWRRRALPLRRPPARLGRPAPALPRSGPLAPGEPPAPGVGPGVPGRRAGRPRPPRPGRSQRTRRRSGPLRGLRACAVPPAGSSRPPPRGPRAGGAAARRARPRPRRDPAVAVADQDGSASRGGRVGDSRWGDGRSRRAPAAALPGRPLTTSRGGLGIPGRGEAGILQRRHRRYQSVEAAYLEQAPNWSLDDPRGK